MRDHEALKLNQVNAVIQQHMFPHCTRDVPHGLHFDHWEFSGFFPDPSSTINLHGNIGAQYRKDGTYHAKRITVDIDLLAEPPKELFRHVDAVLMFAIKNLIGDVMGDHYLL